MPSPFESSNIRYSESTDDTSIGALLGGTNWKDSIIPYSFPSSNSISLWSTFSSGYGSQSGNGEPWSSKFKPLTNSNRNYFEKALQQWANVADIEFIEVSDTTKEVGDIRAAYTFDSDNLTLAWSYLPSGSPLAGDIWINSQGRLNSEEWTPGSMSFETVLHEIGHALGLKHPFSEHSDESDDEPDDDSDDSFESVLSKELDKTIYTIMSYTYANLEGAEGTGFSFHPTTPMVLDIAAMQFLYGANDDFNAGNTIYTFDDAHPYHETIWDAGGSADAIRYTGSIPSLFDLNPMHGSLIGQSVYVQSGGNDIGLPIPNVWIADGVSIENIIAGQSDDILIGNNRSNNLDGGPGIDTLIVEAPRNKFSLTKTATGYTLAEKKNSDHKDKLKNIERLEFTDYKLALDLDGQAGDVAKMLGAVFGASAVTNQSFAGTGLIRMSQGLNYEQLGELAIQSTGLNDNETIVTLLWKNLFGSEPQDSEISPYINLLNNGEISRGALAVLAADSSYNLQNINFYEITQSGIAYV